MKPIFFYFLVPIALFLLVWFVGDPAISSEHAWRFLLHEDLVFIILLGILEIVFTVVAVFGTAFGWFFVITQKWVWVGALILAFAMPATLAYTRNAASSDPNIGFRYHQYALTQGWAE